MTPGRVVPTFDEFEDRHAGLRLRGKAPARRQLAFKRRKEALAHGVVGLDPKQTVRSARYKRPDLTLSPQTN